MWICLFGTILYWDLSYNLPTYVVANVTLSNILMLANCYSLTLISLPKLTAGLARDDVANVRRRYWLSWNCF